MVHQTERLADADVQQHAGSEAFANASEFAHDLITLAELQFQLFALDAQRAGKRMRVPVVLAVAGLVLALGCIPVLLAGLSMLLIQTTVLSRWLSFLIVALAAVAVSGGLAYGAYRMLQRGLQPLARSQREFQRNLRWVKRVLKTRNNQQP